MTQPKINDWIKTPCGRAKYAELDAKTGIPARIRLSWFILIAAIRDWNITNPAQIDDSES